MQMLIPRVKEGREGLLNESTSAKIAADFPYAILTTPKSEDPLDEKPQGTTQSLTHLVLYGTFGALTSLVDHTGEPILYHSSTLVHSRHHFSSLSSPIEGLMHITANDGKHTISQLT